MFVDNAAMQLVKDPAQFDVILTENMFGDILSDEASMVTGSIGMLASASLNETKFGMYEPSGGSAPDIAGQNKASEVSFRQALYTAIDIYRNRKRFQEATAHPLRKQYYEKGSEEKLDLTKEE